MRKMLKIVLITGGTGSFGHGFVRTILADPEIGMVRIFSRDEHKQRLMRLAFPDRVSFYIGDVRDKDRLMRAMDGCDWVVHAAALKQAPLGETEPQEFIKTNITGSINIIEASQDAGVQKAILISTDKAVEPINLYGATKMCAEKAFLQADVTRGTKKTRFSVVRYGNVACTNGSIIPVFLSLGSSPTLICDPDATRFWITLEQANKFVFESLKSMNGGETFIPKMKSVRITDIADAIRPGRPAMVIGLRNGDKLHEIIEVNQFGERITSDKNEFVTVEEIKDAADEYLHKHKSTVAV